MNSDKDITMNKFSLIRSFFAAILIVLAPFTLSAQEISADPSDAVKIDINSADAQTIAQGLVGVGMVRAKEIVAYRDMYGNFQSLDELTAVAGVGAATVDKNRHLMLVPAKE
jgi:competence protein ComEA